MVKEKTTIDIDLEDIGTAKAPKKDKHILVVALAIALALVCVVVSVLLVRTYNQGKALQQQLDEATQQMAALQQQLDTEKSRNDDLHKDSETLKSENQVLQEENAALKLQISLQGQMFPKEIYEGKKLVALTFDDGPGGYTAELLDFLKAEGVRATFFVLGKNANAYPDLLKRMDKEGHAIGNHSYNHPNLASLSEASMKAQIDNCNAAINKAVGHDAVALRCPGGSNSPAVQKYAKEKGLPIIYWSVDTKDWQSRNKDKILSVAFGNKGIKDGSVVLMHDIHRPTIDATKEMVTRLKKEGYTFVTVPELLSVRLDKVEAGQVYVSAPPKG